MNLRRTTLELRLTLTGLWAVATAADGAYRLDADMTG
jgi:hypothetical protein